MGWESKTLPPNITRLMSDDQRKPFGKAAWTQQQCDEKQIKEAERTLQSEICAYLGLHTIEYINPPMNRKSSLPSGWPDFTFAYLPRGAKVGIPIGVECKVFGKKPEPHQSECHERMRRNGWIVIVAYSVADVQKLMREIDAGL